jgi:hypothetical protein
VLDGSHEQVGLEPADAEAAGGGEQGAALRVAQHGALEPGGDFTREQLGPGARRGGQREGGGKAAGRRACRRVPRAEVPQLVVEARGMTAVCRPNSPGGAAVRDISLGV